MDQVNHLVDVHVVLPPFYTPTINSSVTIVVVDVAVLLVLTSYWSLHHREGSQEAHSIPDQGSLTLTFSAYQVKSILTCLGRMCPQRLGATRV